MTPVQVPVTLQALNGTGPGMIGILLQAFLGIVFVLGLFWAIVWLWDAARINLVARAKEQHKDRCVCGKYRFVDGARSHDDRSVRHSRELCQPFREVIDR